MSVDLGSAHGQIILDADGVSRGVSQAGASLRQLESFAASAGASFARFATDVAGFVVKASAAVAVGMGGIVAAGVKGAAELEQAVANIKSIKPDIDTSAVFASLNAISTRVPQTAQQLADSLFNIFSSINVTQQDALRLTEQFAQGAIGAQTDAQTFGTAILGVMNAYGLSVQDATNLSDIFFNTVNRGVVTGGELAQNLGTVTQAAKAAGVGFDELGALIVGVTKEGGPASQNINNLSNLLNKITTEGAQKAINGLGVATVDATGNFRPLIDILGDLKPRLDGLTEAERNAALQKIFPDIQARQGAQVILSQLDAVRAALAENRSASGSAATAFANMINTFKSQAALLRNTALADLRTFGAAFLPLGTTIVSSLNNLLRQAAPQIEALSAQLAALAGRGLQALTRGVPAAVAAVRLLIVAIASLFRAFRTGDFNQAFGAIIAGISAAFGSDAAAAVALFTSRALRGMQLIRDAVLTARQAAAGDWFGGQDESINTFVRSIGRFTQLARDAFLTVRQVFDREWISSPEIQPVIRAIGEVAVAARDLGERLRAAGQAFAATFTPERVAILRQFVADLLAARVDILVNGLRLLGQVLPPVIEGLGRLVGLAIDGLGALQRTGHEAEVLRAALLLLGGVLALNQFADFVDGARSAESALLAFFRTATRGPRLVVTTIRAIYEVVGDAAAFAANAARSGTATVTRVVSVIFAGARDAAIWAQLYAEQAVQTITRAIRTIWEKVPPAPNIPDLLVRAIPQFDTSGIGATAIPPLTVQVNPQINTGISLGSIGADLGAKLAGGIALGIGTAIGTAIAGSAFVASLGAALGAATVAAAPVLIVAAGVLAQALVVAFIARTVAGLIAEAGGIGPYLANIFLQAIPFALGAAAGLLANAGLQMVLFVIQGLTSGVPALIAAVQSNFTTILTTISAILFPLPTLIAVTLAQILPTLVAFGAQVATTVGGAFSQVGTIVNQTLGQLGTIAATAFAAVLAVVQGVGAQIVAAVQAAFAPVAAVIQAIIAGDWGGAVQAGIALLVALFVTLPAQVVGILADGFGQIAGIIGSSLSAAAGAVGEAFAGIVTAVASAGAQIVASVGEAFSTVGSTISSALSGIASAITEFLSSYVSGFRSTFNGELPAAVASGMAQLVAAIQSGIGQAVALVASLPGQIAGAIGSLGGILFSAGVSAMQGLLSGIQSQVGAILGAVAGIAGQIAGAFADALKMRSPSRVMMTLGELTIEGVVVGIERAAGTATRAAASVAASIFGAFRDGLGQPAIDGAGATGRLADLARDFAARAVELGDETLDAANRFLDLAGKAVALIRDGVAALGTVGDATLPAQADVDRFVAGLLLIVRAITTAGQALDAAATEAAGTFSEGAQKIVALVRPAAEALAAIAGVQLPTEADVAGLVGGTLRVVRGLIAAGATLAADGLAAGAAFAADAKSILDLVAPAVAALRAITELVVPSDEQILVFGERLLRVILRIGEIGGLLASRGVEAAASFAKDAAIITGFIKPAVDGLSSLTTLAVPSDQQILTFGERLMRVILRIGEIGNLLDAGGVARAASFIEQAGRILAQIKPAIDALTSLSTIGDVRGSIEPQLAMFEALILRVQTLTSALGGMGSAIRALPTTGGTGALGVLSAMPTGFAPVQQVITHRWEGAVSFEFLGSNGTWITSSLRADDVALTQTADLVGSKFEEALLASGAQPQGAA